jgi:membrane protein involved in colicin uptake
MSAAVTAMGKGRAAWAAIGLVLGAIMAAPASAQEVFRCTSPEGKVTYQQAPCPKIDEGRKIDATPANPDYDPSQRDRVLKQGEEAQRRLDDRAAREAEEERKRRAEREREEERARQREREAQEREEAREVYAPYWIHGTPPPPRPTPPPRPQPRAPQAPTAR